VSEPPGPSPYDPTQPHSQPGPYGYPQQPGYGGTPYPQQQPGGYPPPPGQYGYPGHPQQPGYGPGPYGYQQIPGGLPPGMPPLAGWGARVGATLLDWLMFGLVPTGLFMVGYVRIIKKTVDAQDACDRIGIRASDCPTPDYPGSAFALMAVGGLLNLAVLLFLCYREGATGQTPGKRIVGIRLLREYDGSALGFGLAFGRRLLHVLDGLACGLGYLWPLWDQKRQTFADKMVHTVEIRDQR
jgi:uncharacterized RDD family membrane protein YckC